jgi:hypothetical protein
VRWKGPVLALVGGAAVAGVAIGLSVGGAGSSSKATTPVADASQTAENADTGGTTVGDKSKTTPGHRLLVGTVDDVLKQPDPAAAAELMHVSHGAGFDAVLVSSEWRRRLTAPSAADLRGLRNVVRAAQREDMRVFVFVWHGLSGSTPRTPALRSQFAAYTAALARQFPQVQGIVVGNEPNLNTFWMPQFGPGGSDVAAKGYLDLLAKTYDALKAVSPRIQVLGGALAPRGSDRPRLHRDTHSPTRFLKDLGAAYRASGRTKPIMDAFAMHPYMRASAFPPSGTHPDSTTITLADYPKLAAVLTRAFAGTPQRGRGLPIYYTEFGVQTQVPGAHRRAYTDVNSPAAADAVDPETQARYYREALSLVSCQPTVKALFVFHTFDETDLAGWQSGLYYADRAPKPSLDEFREAARAARDGSLTRCYAGTFVRN